MTSAHDRLAEDFLSHVLELVGAHRVEHATDPTVLDLPEHMRPAYGAWLAKYRIGIEHVDGTDRALGIPIRWTAPAIRSTM